MIEHVEAAWVCGAPDSHIIILFCRAGARRSQSIGFGVPTLLDVRAASSDCSRSARIRTAWS
jgi:hypothetical protein